MGINILYIFLFAIFINLGVSYGSLSWWMAWYREWCSLVRIRPWLVYVPESLRAWPCGVYAPSSNEALRQAPAMTTNGRKPSTKKNQSVSKGAHIFSKMHLCLKVLTFSKYSEHPGHEPEINWTCMYSVVLGIFLLFHITNKSLGKCCGHKRRFRQKRHFGWTVFLLFSKILLRT